MICVLDSSAIIAFFNNETGADVVENILLDAACDKLVHSINLCEVYYDAIRRKDEIQAEQIVKDLFSMKVVERSDFDQLFWKEVGKLKARYRASLADFCGVVLTRKLGGTFLTADHHEFDKLTADNVCSIQFIR